MALRITGLRETTAKLEGLRRRMTDLRPALEPVAAEALELIDEAWAARRSPGGEAWPPTVEASDADGELEGAHQVVAEPTGLRIVVPVRYASFQFFGTKHSPARNPLPVERAGGRFVLSRSGAAGEWVERMFARVKAHLTGGTP